MYNSLIATSTQARLENVSEEVVPIRKSLLKAYDKYWDTSEDGTSSPQLLFPEQSDTTVLQFVNEGKWTSALKYIRHNRITWLNDLISNSPDDEDDVVNILTVFCNHLVDTRPNAFIMIDADDLMNIQGCLMDELMQLMASLNETETKVKEQKEKNYASH